MRTEHELRSALRALEQEAPAAEQVLHYVTGRSGRAAARPGRRPGRRLIPGIAAAAAVTGIVVAVTQATAPSGVTPSSARAALQSIPPYYMALLLDPPPKGSGELGGISFRNYAVVRDTVSGATLATVRPPQGYSMFDWMSGADDDRTFVLGAEPAGPADAGPGTETETFFEAQFNPASDAVALTPLTLPGLPVIYYMDAVALSPDGTRLAVASDNGTAHITVYSLPSGTAKTWTGPRSNVPGSFGASSSGILTWSSTELLGYGWVNPFSEYLLNTNIPAGRLLPDSRRVLCLEGSVSGFGGAEYNGYLTPDGTTVIAPVRQSVPVGQDPPSCQTPGPFPTPSGGPAALEGFSVKTGQATSIIYTSLPHGITLDSTIWWSNSSGSVLVLEGHTGTVKNARQVEGVFSGGVFFPIPGTSGATSATQSLVPGTPSPERSALPYIQRLAF
jgi:hypothetical protein